MVERRYRWIFPLLMGSTALAGILGIIAILWSLVGLVGNPMWADERLALGRVGTFLLLRAALPALAAAVGLWVGVATARLRSAEPHVAALAVFSVAAGASQALLSVFELQAVPAGDALPNIPQSAIATLDGLGEVALVLAVGAFVQLSRVFGDQPTALRSWIWRLLGSRWVWLVLAISFVISTALEQTLRHTAAASVAYAPFYTVLALSGLRLWRASFVSSTEVKNRGIWLVHGAIGFLLGVVVLRGVVRASGSELFHLWSLPSTLGTLFAVLATAYAVFFRGAAGPNLVLRAGSLYGLGGGLAVFLFAGLEELFSSWLSSAMSLPSSLGSFVAAGVVGFIVAAIRKRIPVPAVSGSNDQGQQPNGNT